MKLSGVGGLACVLAAALFGAAAAAQQAKTVADVTIRYGLVTAIDAEHADAQHGTHKGGHGSGMEHLVISLAQARDGMHIAGAKVVVRVRDPKGKVEVKPLQAMVTSGVPDYSEVFNFGWTGKYTIDLTIRLQGIVEPLNARFVHNHVI
jgi:hypothetical protein